MIWSPTSDGGFHLQFARSASQKGFSRSKIAKSRSDIAKPGFQKPLSDIQIPLSNSDITKSGFDLAKSDFQIPFSRSEITKSNLEIAKSDSDIAKSKAGLAMSLSCFWNGLSHLFTRKAASKKIDRTVENSLQNPIIENAAASRSFPP